MKVLTATPRAMRSAMLMLVAASIMTACAVRQPTTGSAAGSPISSNWLDVVRLERGTVVNVASFSGAPVNGRFMSATDDSVTLRLEGAVPDAILARADVRRVSVVKRQTGRNAKLGFFGGAVAGGAVGGLTTGSNQLPWAAFLAATWGSIGALAGAIAGDHDVRHRVIYIAPGQFTGRP